jgi:ATP-binding cassette, subfamily B, bacterial PglK
VSRTNQTLHYLFAVLTRRERWQLLVLAVLALAGAMAEAVSIGAVFPFIALISNPEAVLQHPAAIWLLRNVGLRGVNQLVLMAACALIAVYAVKNLFLAALYAYQSRFLCVVEARLGIALLTSYLQSPFTERLATNSADRIRIVTGEVGKVTTGVMLSIITLVSEGLVVVVLSSLLLFAEPLVAVVALVVVGAVALMMQTVFRRWVDAYRESRVATHSGMYRWVNEGLGALKEIKVLGREEHVIGEFARNSHMYAHGTYIFTTLNLLPRLIFETAAICALLLAVIATVLTDKPLHGIVPVLTMFGLAAVRLLPSSSRILHSLNTLRYFVPAVETVALDLLRAPRSEQVSGALEPAAPRAPQRFESLELCRVKYCYPGTETPGLADIDLHLERGKAVAVLGRSGSGKTTLADLLLGLLEPQEGTMKVNGQIVRSLRDEFRGMAGLVPQEIYLVDNTVRRNVAFGLADQLIDDSRVWAALRLARLEDRIRELPEMLDTVVGERGATLSGGERQRLGIARALYTDPQILILDEATSALDETTEAEFSRTLQSLRGEKTIIVITHRLRSVAWCDRAVVMSNGRIIADGPFRMVSHHAALLDSDESLRRENALTRAQ